jgi:predicted double-glycine peptidase
MSVKCLSFITARRWYSRSRLHVRSRISSRLRHLGLDRLTKSGGSRVAGALILVTLFMHGSARAEGNQPVQSVLEIRHDRVMIQKWDLSCGAAALGTLLRYQFGEPVSEEEIARALMGRAEYVGHPELVQLREGFSFLDLKRYVQTYRTGLYKGEGLGQLDLNDLIEQAPLMVAVNALGYNHFVVFRGVMGDRILVADPAWGNRTMTIDKFQRMWLDYGEPVGHVGFVVERADGQKLPNRLQPKPSDFVLLR